MYNMLICDDEPYVLDLLRESIDWKRYDVRVGGTALNGQMGLNAFQMTRFDIVLADIKMPLMSGVEMAKKMREKDKRVQIIFLTSLGEFEYAQSAVNIGACGYILKPFRNEELITAVQTAVSRLDSKGEGWPAQTDKGTEGTEDNEGFIVENVNKLISENIGKKLSVKTIAEYFGYSPNYLGHLYHKHTGMFIGDQIVKIKMEHAVELLKIPQNQIGSIAERLGYSDYAYFIKQFKEYYGETPKAFRDSSLRRKK